MSVDPTFAVRHRRLSMWALLPLLALALGFATPVAGASEDEQDATSVDTPVDPEVERLFEAIVKVQSHAVEGARSARSLGTDRQGTGVVVGNKGLILTIGYLVVEAENIDIVDSRGRTLPATTVAYDHATGLALLRPIPPFSPAPVRLGDASKLNERDPVLIINHEGRSGATAAAVVSRRSFSGNWEYLLDKAIFTSPPSLNWSGAALIGPEGTLLGIGSLIVRDAAGGAEQIPGNMFVPIDILKPILPDLVRSGRRKGPARPWLGVAADEVQGRLVVTRVSPEGPADRAGIETGDIVLAVGGAPVHNQEDFYRKVWGRGAAGSEIRLRVLRGASVREMRVKSIDRVAYFKPRTTY